MMVDDSLRLSTDMTLDDDDDLICYQNDRDWIWKSLLPTTNARGDHCHFDCKIDVMPSRCFFFFGIRPERISFNHVFFLLYI